MYRVNHTGPWPIIDANSTRVKRTSGAVLGSIDTLNVCLDTANLGGNKSAFINASYQALITLTAGTNISFGVALNPLETHMLEDQAVFLEVYGSVIGEELSSATCNWFAGLFDSASATLANGWDATHNIISDPCWLPTLSGYQHKSICTQVLLRDIISGGGNLDKFIGFGFSINNYSTTSKPFNNLAYTLGARIAFEPISTYKRY